MIGVVGSVVGWVFRRGIVLTDACIAVGLALAVLLSTLLRNPLTPCFSPLVS